MPSLPLTPTELGRIAGPLLIGYILNWGLFGVLSVQVYVYYLGFPKDQTAYKVLVYGSYLLEAAQTFVFTSSAFRTFALGFGNPAVLDEVDILWFSVPIMSGMVAFVSQTFYAYRISVLAQTNRLAILIMLFACLSLAGSIALGVETKKAVRFSRLLQKNSFTTAGIWEGGSAICDVLIAASMTYYLKRRDTGIKQTQVLLAKIIRLTIETGTLTAAVAILTLILTFLPGQPTYYQTSVSVLGKVYSNSMMVVFNSRMIMGSSNATSTATHELPMTPQNARTRNDFEFGNHSKHGGVVISREEVVSFTQSSNVSQDIKRSSSPPL